MARINSRSGSINRGAPNTEALKFAKVGPGFIDMRHYDDGEVVLLTAAQARYLLMAGSIETLEQRAARLAQDSTQAKEASHGSSGARVRQGNRNTHRRGSE